MNITVRTIADLVQGEIVGDPETILTGPGKIEDAPPGSITFLANEKYAHHLSSSKAAAVLVSRQFVPESASHPVLIKVDNVYLALSLLLRNFDGGLSFEKKVSDKASVSDTAKIGADVSIGEFTVVKQGVVIEEGSVVYGQVYIGDNVKIGKNTKIYPGVRIYHNCVIGDHCVIHANSVIGSDGFGFAHDENGNYSKIPQIGNVVIEDNVEIGANTVIDRATMGSTVIKSGVKLDNLIQIAHNVVIGEHTVIAAQTGIAGSTKVGKRCMIGGQVGIVGHLSVADGAMIQAQSGVASEVKEPGSKLYGSPAIEYSSFLRSYAHFKKLPDIAQRIRDLEKEIELLKKQIIQSS